MDDAMTSVPNRVTSPNSVIQPDAERKNSPGRGEEHAPVHQEAGPDRDEVKDHIHDLSAAVDAANTYLREKNSPYRMSISSDGPDILIEIEISAAEGPVRRIIKRNITHEDFLRLIDQVTGGEGLLYDDRV